MNIHSEFTILDDVELIFHEVIQHSHLETAADLGSVFKFCAYY